jgi:hypothetical protein
VAEIMFACRFSFSNLIREKIEANYRECNVLKSFSKTSKMPFI